jgi:hypothetical protein
MNAKALIVDGDVNLRAPRRRLHQRENCEFAVVRDRRDAVARVMAGRLSGNQSPADSRNTGRKPPGLSIGMRALRGIQLAVRLSKPMAVGPEL